MKVESEIVKELVERTRGSDWVAESIRFNEEGKAHDTSKGAFWKHLVLTLLTTQQRDGKGSAVDKFENSDPFPLELDTYESLDDQQVAKTLEEFHFRFAKPVTCHLRANHGRLFGKQSLWSSIEPLLGQLAHQRNSGPPNPNHRELERKVAHQLAGNLKGIGPKQSRNLLQWLGLIRYETPLDSRVTRWLSDNLGWNIPLSSLNDQDGYEFWLDRLQTVCVDAGILPTVFDAAAFEEGKAPRVERNPAACIGYVNRNGQVVVRNTDLRNPDRNHSIFNLACSHCGHVYGSYGSAIVECQCPKCQGGTPGLEYTTP